MIQYVILESGAFLGKSIVRYDLFKLSEFQYAESKGHDMHP